MRPLVILFLVPGFSLGLVAGVAHLVGPVDMGSAQQTNLVWSNRVFTTRQDFEGWLVSRGSSYELLSQRHPAAAHHFDDAALRSLATSSKAQDSRRYAQSGGALLITIISCAVILALLALPRLVGSARFLLDPHSTRLRLRAPPLALVGAAGKPRSALLPDAVHSDWRKGWATLGRLGRIAPGRAAVAARRNSRLMRHYLPRATFYVTAVVLSFAIGAWVAIYLQ